jgi:hypothetical protein
MLGDVVAVASLGTLELVATLVGEVAAVETLAVGTLATVGRVATVGPVAAVETLAVGTLATVGPVATVGRVAAVGAAAVSGPCSCLRVDSIGECSLRALSWVSADPVPNASAGTGPDCGAFGPAVAPESTSSDWAPRSLALRASAVTLGVCDETLSSLDVTLSTCGVTLSACGVTLSTCAVTLSALSDTPTRP